MATDDTLSAFTSQLITAEVFSCAVCKNLLRPPIMIFDHVGNACFACAESSPEVAGAIGYRNLQFEVILSHLKVPCKYHGAGCKDQVMFEHLEDHQKNCKFQTKLCLLSDEGCEWQGVQSHFEKHFMDDHPKHVIGSTNGTFLVDINLVGAINISKFLKGKRDSCIIRITNTPDASGISYAISHVKSLESDCACFIRHLGVNGNHIETKCLPSTSNDGSAAEVAEAQIDVGALKQVTGAGNVITIEVKLVSPGEAQELDERMMHYFECPVCNNLMRPPIYQCKFGHSFCNSCRSRLEKCPTCRGIFGSTRNYSLEGLTSRILYACVYSHLGCEETVTAADTAKHESVCIFKPYACPVTDCNYQGNYSTIVPHMNEKHAEKVINSHYHKTTCDFRLEQLMDFYNHSQKFFLIFSDNIFRLSFKRNSDYSFWAVEVIRKTDENATYTYEIGIIDMRRQDKKLIRTDLCFSESHNSEDLFKKCILFPNNIISSYASNSTFTYYCQIHRRP